MLFNVPPWLRRILTIYDRTPAWVRYGAAALVLVLIGAALL